MHAHGGTPTWTVEEVGEAHAVLTSPGIDEFVVPRAALPDGVEEGHRLEVVASARRVSDTSTTTTGDIPADDSGAEAIFQEALDRLSGVKREGPGNFLKQA